MAYKAENYLTNPKAVLGTWVGPDPYHGECVSYVKAVVPSLPATPKWKKGALVKGNVALQAGTVIATFDKNGKYFGHAAIYEGQSAKGLDVVDQWITPPPQPIHHRTLAFGAHGNSNNGNNFFVVE